MGAGASVEIKEITFNVFVTPGGSEDYPDFEIKVTCPINSTIGQVVDNISSVIKDGLSDDKYDYKFDCSIVGLIPYFGDSWSRFNEGDSILAIASNLEGVDASSSNYLIAVVDTEGFSEDDQIAYWKDKNLSELNGAVVLEVHISEKGEVEILEPIETVALVNFALQQVLTCESDSFSLAFNRTKIGEWERFSLVKNEDGSVSFLSAHGTYLCMEDSGKTVCNRTEIGDWEKWGMEYIGEVEEGYVKLRSHHGLYLALTPEGKLGAVEGGDSATWGVYYAGDEEEFNNME